MLELIATVYFFKDNGNNWIQKNTGITDSIIRSLKINGNNIFAGTDARGVFFSTDSGNRWSKKNFGLLNLHIITLIINSNYIFAGTDESGVFRANLSDISNVDERINVQNNIKIYPNPFYKNITIEINNNLIENKIEIYNLLGIKVLEISTIEQKQPINLESLSNGVYFLRLGNQTKIFIKE